VTENSERGEINDEGERYEKHTSSNSCSPGTSAQRRSATRHGEHHRNARRPYAGHRDARLRRGALVASCSIIVAMLHGADAVSP